MDHRLIAKEWSRLLDEFFATRGEAYGRAVEACLGALRSGRKILAFGNGGSAAEAQHFVAELVNKFLKPRPALRAVTLSTDTSVLTCIGNDISYDAVFSRQIEALGDVGDIALGLTTSGNSPNVLEALKTAKEQGLVTIVLTGWSGGKSAPLADILLDVPSSETPRIQEIHLFLLHLLAGDIEELMFPGH
ncbi:MAG: SIS domain-containing protein [Candidatus Aminicenantes bacterium]|nr:SIS domain-containing protein [Candidatus Aminicenantes bacterium]